jgi:MSHA pilin protein MshC
VSRDGGFSLAELIITIVIAGILAALFVPRMIDTEAKANYFQEEVKAAIRYAQRQAVAQKRCVFVDVSATQVKLFYGNASCAATATPLKFLAGASAGSPYVIDAPSGITLSPVGAFRFDGLGRPAAAVALTVGTKSINVTAETGYVRD